MTFIVAHWNTLHDNLVFWFARGRLFFSALMVGVMCLLIDMQEEDILEHTNVKCHLCTL